MEISETKRELHRYRKKNIKRRYLMNNYFNDERENKVNEVEEAAGQKNITLQDVYDAGVKAGMQYMMDKIEEQYELCKPIYANGRLYWLKNDMENLKDIMDDIEAEYKESNGND